MSIQTRTTALQNEVVRLYCYFNKDSVLWNPIGQPLVEILDTDGVTVLDTIPAVLENNGCFYADWFILKNIPLGDYYDRWTYQWTSTSGASEQTMIINVHSLDSYINFISKGISTQVSNRGFQLMNDLMNDFIYEAQHIPVYFEQGMRVQQENQAKRVKEYYYFALDKNSYSATAGAVYFHNGNRYTVFESLLPTIYSSSTSDESSSSNSSSSSSSLDSSSSTSYAVTTTTTTPYFDQVFLTCTGSVDPLSSGTLSLVSGSGDTTITFTSISKKESKFSTIYGFAYPNWQQDPKPVGFLNKRIVDDGWHADYNGRVYFDTLMAPEDVVNFRYQFAYFSKEELLSFLTLGLKAMNSIPPASETYFSLEQAPHIWDYGILLFAAITALKRMIFGWSFQEKRIVYGRPEEAQAALAVWQDLYKSYMETWTENAKNVKTRKLPGMVMYVTPEYSLPGGRCMSADTYIKCFIGGMEQYLTIKQAYQISLNRSVKVESINSGDLSFERVGKIWMSGNKETYWVKTNKESIRLTSEHLVYLPQQERFINVGSMKKNDTILVNRNGLLIQSKLISDPIFYGKEEVYDIEVPNTENFVGNGIVSHNSRWFRYLYKSGA